MDKLIGDISAMLEDKSNWSGESCGDTAQPPEFDGQRDLIGYYSDKLLSIERTLHKKNLQVRELATELAISSFFPNNPEERKHKAAANGINTELSGYCVVFIRIVDSSNLFHTDKSVEDVGNESAEAIKTIICSIFGELYSECFNSDYAVIDGEYAFLVGSNLEAGEFMSKLAAISENAVNIIEGSFAIRLLACVGPYCHGFTSVSDCFRLALDLREYSMSLPEPPSILLSGDTEINRPIRPNDDEFLSAVVDHQYMNAVISYDFESALEMTMSLVDTRYSGEPGKRRGLKPFLSGRLATTAELLSCSFKGIVVNGVSVQTEIDRMLALSNFDEIVSSLGAVYNMLDEFYNHGGNEHTGTIGSVIAYVTENYAVSSLSVGSICEELGKSRSYLSRVFKQNTGMNLLDFLHTTRITEAKRLLVETDLSITDIGERVGYYSGWTLARVFKRYEGITPSVYRNRVKQITDNR